MQVNSNSKHHRKVSHFSALQHLSKYSVTLNVHINVYLLFQFLFLSGQKESTKEEENGFNCALSGILK